jgi:hypothetical protein
MSETKKVSFSYDLSNSDDLEKLQTVLSAESYKKIVEYFDKDFEKDLMIDLQAVDDKDLNKKDFIRIALNIITNKISDFDVQ